MAVKNQFPIYIPSKGRADSRLTIKALEEMGVPYTVVVEEQEYSEYAKVVPKKNILVLDKTFPELSCFLNKSFMFGMLTLP